MAPHGFRRHHRHRTEPLDHGSTVYRVAFSPDGTRVATGSDDGSARVSTPPPAHELSRLDHGSTVIAVAFSPDGTRVATGSDDGSARIFDATTGTELAASTTAAR